MMLKLTGIGRNRRREKNILNLPIRKIIKVCHQRYRHWLSEGNTLGRFSRNPLNDKGSLRSKGTDKPIEKKSYWPSSKSGKF